MRVVMGARRKYMHGVLDLRLRQRYTVLFSIASSSVRSQWRLGGRDALQHQLLANDDVSASEASRHRSSAASLHVFLRRRRRDFDAIGRLYGFNTDRINSVIVQLDRFTVSFFFVSRLSVVILSQ